MVHQELKRICKGADTAVLFIHGIIGTPKHFEFLYPLIPADFSVHSLLLEGHGKGVEDFSKASMAKWEAQVQRAVAELAKDHRRILIAAHSMGTLFAIDEAIREPKVKGLFLLAAPLLIRPKSQALIQPLKLYFNKIKPNDSRGLAAKAAYGIGEEKNPFKYLGWIPRYLELFKKIRQTRKKLPLLPASATILQSREDELVSIKALSMLRQIPRAKFKTLELSAHYYYHEEDRSFIEQEFSAFIEEKP